MDDIMITCDDYLHLKILINNLDTSEKLQELKSLINEISNRKPFKNLTNDLNLEHKPLPNNNYNRKLELKVTPKNNPPQIFIVDNCKEKEYILRQTDNVSKINDFIYKYCDFDIDESIKASQFADAYNNITGENLTHRMIGLSMNQILNTLPIEKLSNADARYYKGIKFKSGIIT